MNTTITAPKLRPEVKEKWLVALRSGEYEQGRQYLHRRTEDGVDLFCCLGVLCEVARQEGLDVRRSDHSDGLYRYDYEGSMPPMSVRNWAYGDAVSGFVVWHVLVPGVAGLTDSLDALNDEYGMTFDQIANAIEASL